MRKRKMLRKTFVLIICALIILLGILVFATKTKKYNKAEIMTETLNILAYNTNNAQDSLYLSDIDYIANQSYTRYDRIRYDAVNDNGGKITLKIENSGFSFKKGIWAHANSQVTYNISDYDYRYFTAFVGLNTTSTSGDGVRFSIYTSEDGQNWGDAKFEEVKLPGAEATHVIIELEDANYIRLIANQIGNNAADHSVYADAKLVNELSTDSSALETIEEYDRLIKEQYTGQTDITGDLEFNLLKRELVQRVGQFALSSFYNESDENKAVIDWLISDVDNIREYILGGVPDGGNYFNSLTQLSRLYNEYKEDFELTEKLNNKYQPELTYGELYRKMAITLSLTHSKNVSSWMNAGAPENQSDALRRYAIYKYMHKNGMLRKYDNESYAPMFESLRVEEMRLVLNNAIDDESILWLNQYAQDRLDEYKQEKWITPHPYIAYTQPNYNNPVFYDEANRDYFNELFAVKDRNNPEEMIGMYDLVYTIPGGNTIPSYTISVTRGTTDYKLQKVWMNFRNKFGTGAICGGISNSGANIRAAHGIPAFFAYQPYHGVILNYAKYADGRGFWGVDNDCDGWALTSSASTRFLIGWGQETWNIESPLNTQWLYMFKYNALYLVLGQEAINDYDNFVKCEEQTFLAKVYSDDISKQEEIYNIAIEKQGINLDAWVGLINTYKADESKEEGDYYKLAERIAKDLKYFPLPMKHLSNLVKPKLTSPEYVYQFALLQERTLKEASEVPNSATDKVVQPSLTRGEANFLLGRLDRTIATFSFDGEDAGKIILSSRFDGSGVRWDYSIVGKGENENWTKERFHEVSFTDTEEHKWLLSPEELASITADNDIYIHIIGVDYSDKNVYKIDILDQNLPTNIYANDLENKVIGVTEALEWRYTENDTWTSYAVESPNLTGNKTVQVRVSATGIKLPSRASELYTFTEDNWPDTRKYIPIEHLSIHSYSTQSNKSDRPFYATNAIDGNINTIWHTDFGQNVLQQSIKPFISIKLDEPRNISALEFAQKKYREDNPDDIRNARVYVSVDGETWIQGGQIENCETYGELYAVEFENPVYGEYVKIELDTKNMFASLALVNLYEDTTIVTLATFSFDGDNAGKLMITDDFKGTSWQYSLDNGATWKNGNGNEHQLTENELEQINADDDIIVRLTNEDKESTIDILRQDSPVMNPYLNDLENRLINVGNVSNLEWTLESNNETVDNRKWILYSEQEPIVAGDTKLLIRKKASNTLVASDSIEFQFTDDNQLDTEKYISVKNISSVSVSNTTAGRGEEGEKAIDGLPTTMWHSNRRTTTMHDPRWITLELDEPRYISKVEYVKKAGYAYGIPKEGKVSVSVDGENWTEVLNFDNLYNPTTVAELNASDNVKELKLSKTEKAKYVKIECTKSCDYVNGSSNGVPYDYFFSAAMINLYEDTTKVEVPTAEVEYNITQTTNQDVIATLVNESTDITIISEGGNTHTFTENGEFTFEFVDSKGVKGTATAKVDWIVKTLPTATIQYSTTEPTNQDVIASITFDRENVKILDDNGEVIETIAEKGSAYTYTFTQNEIHEVRFEGPYGNRGTTTLEVDWIDKEAPVGTIEYSSTNISNQPVTATITFENEENEEDITITSEGGNTHTFTENDEFTFEFVDKAGNTGTAKAEVTWIDKTLPIATIEYSTTEPTNENVTATVTFNKENVIIVDENDNPIEYGDVYTFTQNGAHEFRFIGPAGNRGSIIATVDWIDKEAPVGTIEYSTTNLTNKDVTATIKFNEDDVIITNNEGRNTYTFESNGIFKFEFVDKLGNVGSAIAEVQWIDKKAVNATITYDINEITNKDVTASITFDKRNVSILDETGEVIAVVAEQGSTYTYTFTENGIHEFRFMGPAGNVGTAIARVDWIDKIPPAATVTYDITESTYSDVIATVTFDEGGVTMTNEKYEPIEDGYTHIFTENGSYTFYYVGPLGNKGKVVAEVTWIKDKPDIGKTGFNTVLEASKTELYPGDEFEVDVNIKDLNVEKGLIAFSGQLEYDTDVLEKISIHSNKGNWNESVMSDKSFKFITDSENRINVDGNVLTIKFRVKETLTEAISTDIKVKNIIASNGIKDIPSDAIQITLSVKKHITEVTSDLYMVEESYIFRIPEGTTVEEFKKHINPKEGIVVTNKLGEELTEETILATGMKLKADELEFELVVIGDINESGGVTTTDLAQLKLHYIGEEILTGARFKAADIDGNNKITITDLAKLKLILIGEEEEV